MSQSRVWDLLRAYYERQGTEAFREVPHQVLDNPFVAAAYARVVLGYLRDVERQGLDLAEPLYIVELGAGAGRFAHGFNRELEALLDAVPLELPPIVYVMTDLAEASVDAWEANPLLAAQPAIDFARFDVAADASLTLRRRGITLDAVKNPLVVIANYLFDSIPCDAFEIAGEQLHECRLAVAGDAIEEMTLDFERVPAPLPHYGDRDLDDLLEHYLEELEDTVFTIPTGAIDCLRRLDALCDSRMLLLMADKAYATEAGLEGRDLPHLDKHGSFSLMLNMHAMTWWMRRRGGETVDSGDRHTTIAVSAMTLGGAHPETLLAYDDQIERFGPDDLMTLTEGLEKTAEHMSLLELVSVLRFTHWDSFTFLGMADTIVEKVAGADGATHEDLRDALSDIYERHYPVPGEGDLPFALGLVLYELGDYEEALACFNASLEQFGPDASTEYNIGLCREQLPQGNDLSFSGE
jgi:tetratricopeptide (TPR) repeat protein